MWIFAIIALVILSLMFPVFRCIITHPVSVTGYGSVDLFNYLRYHLYDDAEPTVGRIICFQGLFGHGKTLSEVHTVRKLYKRYNGKKVFKGGKWVEQKVFILSNVALLTTPYLPFQNMQDLINLCEDIKISDELNDTYSVVYVILDELQNLMNSRNFKTNFDSCSDVMRVLTQMRKFRCSIWYTSTRFNQTDAFIRQDTMYVYDCNKIWRFGRYNIYDAWELENCSDVTKIKPLSRCCYFIRNSDYAAYDTHALADVIEKDVLNGDMIPENERILALDNFGTCEPSKPSFKYKRSQRKK